MEFSTASPTETGWDLAPLAAVAAVAAVAAGNAPGQTSPGEQNTAKV